MIHSEIGEGCENGVKRKAYAIDAKDSPPRASGAQSQETEDDDVKDVAERIEKSEIIGGEGFIVNDVFVSDDVDRVEIKPIDKKKREIQETEYTKMAGALRLGLRGQGGDQRHKLEKKQRIA